MSRHPNTAPFTQGVFYVITGLWPIIHLHSFEKVTGRKQQAMTARTLGGAIAGVGAALIIGSLDARPSKALRWLGIGSAIALGVVDLVLATRSKQSSKVYFADAAAEGAAIASWMIAKPRFIS